MRRRHDLVAVVVVYVWVVHDVAGVRAVAANGRPKRERRGRVNTTRLLAEYGDIPVPVLLEELSTDCPRRQAMQRGQIADVCGIHAPELARVF